MCTQERGLETAEQPELFLMFRDDRWFITFFVPGQGKTMSGLGYFLEGARLFLALLTNVAITVALCDGEVAGDTVGRVRGGAQLWH